MDILFWSGGKDAYLALHFYREAHPNTEVGLLTTYDETDEMVPHQNIPLKDIKTQAAHLNLPLITVPLPPECPNSIYLERVHEELKNADKPVNNLIFGDWKLKDIRKWREQEYGKLGYACVFPIWKKSIHQLLPVLLLKPIEIKISAVNKEYQSILRVGEVYDQALVSQLSHFPEIDPMGENGEFHTKIEFKDLKEKVQ